MTARVTAPLFEVEFNDPRPVLDIQRHRPYAVAAAHRPSGRGRRPRTVPDGLQ